ncbi:MAG: crossover junction endodeoxyribonuclease RuvC [Thermodesulfovibrio sp.]|nr:crossover junction endodeoxyribonuclease RuvC [Thermodesulfovibrio sp.]
MLGIDPGSIFCGYGVIRSNGRDASYIASGRIAPPASNPLHIRLKAIHEALTEIIATYQPTDVVVEKVFFAKSAKAALQLGQARGVVLLAAACGGITLHERSALEVKKAVVGYGRAEKSQVQEMVKMILKIRGTLYPDSADALALALCYMNTLQFNIAVKSQNNHMTEQQ